MKIEVTLQNIEKATKVVNGNLYINEVQCADIQLHSSETPITIQAIGVKEEQLIREAEIYCNSLYGVKSKNEQVEYIPMNLDLYMRDCIKFKLLDMLSENNIVYGKSDPPYQTVGLSSPVNTLLKSRLGEVILIASLQEFIVPRLQEGEKIWWVNLPDNVVNIVGKEHFYDKEPKYVQKKDLKIIMDRPRGKGGPKQ